MANENEIPSWVQSLIDTQTALVGSIKDLSGKVGQLEKENKAIKEGIKDVVPIKEEEASQEELDSIFDYVKL